MEIFIIRNRSNGIQETKKKETQSNSYLYLYRCIRSKRNIFLEYIVFNDHKYKKKHNTAL